MLSGIRKTKPTYFFSPRRQSPHTATTPLGCQWTCRKQKKNYSLPLFDCATKHMVCNNRPFVMSKRALLIPGRWRPCSLAAFLLSGHAGASKTLSFSLKLNSVTLLHTMTQIILSRFLGETKNTLFDLWLGKCFFSPKFFYKMTWVIDLIEWPYLCVMNLCLFFVYFTSARRCENAKTVFSFKETKNKTKHFDQQWI